MSIHEGDPLPGGALAQRLVCEFANDPLGIDTPRPRLGWQAAGEARGTTQTAYQVELVGASDGRPIWDSGRVETSEQTAVVTAGEPLASNTGYRWRVRLWDGRAQAGPWSGWATFETALLDPAEWQAGWVRGGNLIRHEFELRGPVARARVHVCGLGYYELRMNGARIGDHVLDPAWTDYRKRAMYATYDVTRDLSEGSNAIAVMLGNGRYSPYEEVRAKNWHPLRKFGSSPVLILQLHVDYADGTAEVIGTDDSWRVTDGPIVRDDIYDGETYDARIEQEGWDAAGFDDSLWLPAEPAEDEIGTLVSQGTLPPVKVMKSRNAVAVTQPSPGVCLYDFGQNFAGWARLRVSGPSGTTVRLRFAELVHEKTGMLNPQTNRNAIATDTYICRGEGTEVYEPRFTYHGFRYVEVTGYPGVPSVDDVEARVVHSSVPTVGNFSCSDELVNQIHSNYRWTQVSNLHSVPTDCCQRDERMGWVGDAQLSAEAAVFNYDMAAFYSKFAADIRESQLRSGSVAGVSPPYWDVYPADPTYATAAVEFPWVVSRYYDDRRIVDESLDSMARWVDFLGEQADEDGIISFGLFGDWCPPMHANPVDTPFEITSTWYHAHDALLVSRMARRVGNETVAEKYEKVFAKAADAFNRRFLKGERYSASKFSEQELEAKIKSWLDQLPPEEHPAIKKRYATLYSASSQTSNLLPLWLGIVPEEAVDEVFGTLVRDIEATRSWHINTGVVGVKFLFDVLLERGRPDLAIRLVTQTTFPSWGYQIREGATTLWERWEYLDSDQVFNSHSHPFSGSVDAWFYKAIGGIAMADDAVGFERIEMAPIDVPEIRYASASVQSVRGTIVSSWRRDEESYTHRVVVPGNCTAAVALPTNGFQRPAVRESGRVIWDGTAHGLCDGVLDVGQELNRVRVVVGSGAYDFVVEEAVR